MNGEESDSTGDPIRNRMNEARLKHIICLC